MSSTAIQPSIIISTYNWPEALNLTLESIRFQSVLPLEVIIADDGSTQETKNLIINLKENYPVPIIHVWHPDTGFQLSKIRNKAIAVASGNYIIQIDGDIILNKFFVHDHLAIAEKNHFVSGSRVWLNKKVSEEILKNGVSTLSTSIILKSKNMLNSLRITSLSKWFADSYKQKGKHKFDVKGCNMSFWKEDLVKVNGYNEAISGWGSEDRELAARLMKSGVKKRYLKMAGIAFHIYHNLASRNQEEENKDILSKTITESNFRALRGLDQHFSDLKNLVV